MQFLQFYKKLSTKQCVIALIFLYLTFFPSAVLFACIGDAALTWMKESNFQSFVFNLVEFVLPPFLMITTCCVLLAILIIKSTSRIYKRIWTAQLIVIIFLSTVPIIPMPILPQSGIYTPIALGCYDTVAAFTNLVLLRSKMH